MEDRARTPQEILQDAEYGFPYHHVPRYGDGFTQHFVWTWGLNYACTLEYILSELAQIRFASFLDIGCGDGRLAKEIVERFPEARVTGMDLSSRAVALARAMSGGAEFIEGDICTVDPGGPFDAGALIEVVEHLPPDELRAFIEACSKRIRPGGILLLTTPHANLRVPPKHFQHFTSVSLAGLVDPWFTVERTVFLEPRPSREARALRALLCNRLFVLNWKRGLRWIYRRYRRKHFLADGEAGCERIYMRLRRTLPAVPTEAPDDVLPPVQRVVECPAEGLEHGEAAGGPS